MPDPQPVPNPPAALASGTVEAASRWLRDDDIPLGCECADPALQIERWLAELPGPAASGPAA